MTTLTCEEVIEMSMVACLLQVARSARILSCVRTWELLCADDNVAMPGVIEMSMIASLLQVARGARIPKVV